MKSIPELVCLHDGRAGVRAMLEVQACEGPSGGEEAPVLDFVASSATLDRYHEVIEPGGWRLEAYRRNPVFQNAHNYGDIIFTLGKAVVTEVRTVGSAPALFQRIEFATEVNPMARIAYGLYRGGFLRAVSVGFIPIRWENGEGESAFRRKYLEQELLEVSAVAIPANPDALKLGLKAGAVRREDVQEAQDLVVMMIEKQMEDLRIWNLARTLHRVMRA